MICAKCIFIAALICMAAYDININSTKLINRKKV